MKQRNKNQMTICIFSFLFTLLVVIIGSIAGGFAPFGEKSVLVASNNSDYLTHYYKLYDFFKSSGHSMLSNTLGSGYDISTLFTYKLSDPTNYLILLFERSSIPAVLNVLYIIKVAFAGLAMSVLLCYKKNHFIVNNNNKYTNSSSAEKKKNLLIGFKEEPKSFIGSFFYNTDWTIIGISMAYALSVPMISIGMNTAYTSSIALLPLVIYGIEKLLQTNKPYTFILFFTLSNYCNLHMSIITGLFIILFFFTREFKDAKDFLIKFKGFMIGLILSITASGIIIINSVGSELFNKDFSTDFPIYGSINPFNLIKQLMTRNTLSAYSLYNNYLDISFGVGFIFFSILYMFTKTNKNTTKLKNLLLTLFLFFGSGITTFRYLFNGMTQTKDGSIHYSYIIVFMFLWISFETIQDMNSVRNKYVIITGIVSCSLIIATIFLASDYDNINSFIISLELIFGFFIITLLYKGHNLTKSFYSFLILIVLLIEIIPNNFINVKKIATGFSSQKITRIKEYQEYEASKFIHEKEPNAKIICYDNYKFDDTPFTICYSGYDYVLSKTPLSDSYLEYVSSFSTDNNKNELNIYRNKYSIPYAIYDNKVSDFIYNQEKPFSNANIFTNDYLHQKNLFIEGDITANSALSYDGSTVSISFNPSIMGDLYLKAHHVSHIGETKTTDEIAIHQNSIRMSFLKDNKVYQICAFDLKALDNNYNSSERIIADNLYDQKTDISSSKDGYISTGLPCIRSFNYYVNNEKVKPISFLSSNSLIPVKAGNNTVEIRFNPIYLVYGIIISIFSILIIIAMSHKKYIFKSSKIIDKIADNINDYKVYYISIIIITILFIICQMLVSGYPFGQRPVIGGDGLAQQYAAWVGHNNQIKAGNFTSFITYDIAGFKDVYRVVANDFITPWNFIKYSILPESLYLFDYTFRYFLVPILAAVTIIFYLTHREGYRFDKKDHRLIPIALMYSIGSYGMVFFQYEGFKYTCYLPLIILGMEKLVYHKKNALYICSLVLVMLFDPYHAFLLCEFLALYFFTMNFKGIVDFIKKGIRFGLSSIAAAGLTAFTIIPFYAFTTESVYTDLDKKGASLFKTYLNPLLFLSDYRNSNVFSSVNYNNAQAAIYSGMLLIFVIPLYLICKKIPLKKRIKVVTLSALLYLSFNNEMLNYIFHGFHFQSLVPNRHAVFFVFVMITMLATIIYNINNYSISKLQATILITSSAYILLFIINRGIDKTSFIISICILSAFMISAVLSAVKHLSNAKTLKIMLYITIIDLIINYLLVLPNHISSGSDLLSESKSINKLSDNNPETQRFNYLTEYIGDHPLYHNIGDTTKVHTLSYFSSGYTSDIVNRLNYYNLTAGGNNMEYRGGNPLADIMLNIKYHIENIYDDSAYSIYNKVDQYNNYILYENPYYVSMGMVVNNNTEIKNLSIADYIYTDNNSKNILDYQNQMAKLMGGKDIYEKINIELIQADTEYDPNKNYYILGESYSYKESNSEENNYIPIQIKISDSITGKIYVGMEHKIYFIGEVDSNNHELFIDYPEELIDNNDNFTPTIAVLNEENLSALSQTLSQNKLTNLKEDGKCIYADLDSKISGELYISLPYYEAWKIYVDDQLVEKERFMGGIGVPIKAGNHSIRMEYHPEGALLGIMISITTLILIIGYSIISTRNKSKIEKQNNTVEL